MDNVEHIKPETRMLKSIVPSDMQTDQKVVCSAEEDGRTFRMQN